MQIIAPQAIIYSHIHITPLSGASGMGNEETDLLDYEVVVEDGAAYSKASEELKKRCDEAEIKYELFEDNEGIPRYYEIYLQAGRNERSLILSKTQKIKDLLSCPFEKYVFLGDYLAVASYELGSIEALVSSLSPLPLPSEVIMRTLMRVFSREGSGKDEETSDGEFLLTAEKEIEGRTIKLSMSNNLLPLLTVARSRPRQLSIKIERLNISRHDKALGILERISGALFFQIDMLTNLPFTLTRERRPRILRPGISKSSDQSSIVGFKFPEHQYDKEPLSLYWYAKSATQMPLLQFFAYYQAIEFYFPVYSQIEAKRRVSHVLKDPTFDKSKDTDIIRLISSVTQGSRSGFGDERSQLKATINECVSEQELRKFIETKPYLKKFYSSKDKKISSCIIPVMNPSEDLRSKVGERIYDIRCKIAHTKSGENKEGVELLLPFSKEAEMLNYDIELLQFIARQVIIESSRPITI